MGWKSGYLWPKEKEKGYKRGHLNFWYDCFPQMNLAGLLYFTDGDNYTMKIKAYTCILQIEYTRRYCIIGWLYILHSSNINVSYQDLLSYLLSASPISSVNLFCLPMKSGRSFNKPTIKPGRWITPNRHVWLLQTNRFSPHKTGPAGYLSYRWRFPTERDKSSDTFSPVNRVERGESCWQILHLLYTALSPVFKTFARSATEQREHNSEAMFKLYGSQVEKKKSHAFCSFVGRLPASI